MPETPHQPDTGIQQPALPGLLRRPPRRVLPTPTELALERARTRLIFFALLLVLVFAVIAGRVALLTLTPVEEDNAAQTPHQPAGMGRADITDRNGVLLATSLPTQSACANTRHIDDADGLARDIQKILPELNAAKLAESFKTRKGCAPIKRHLTPRQFAALNALGAGAIEFSADEERLFPQAALTAHLVGTTDPDNIGTSGIEKKFDQRLRESHEPLHLTLDVRVQHILHQALSEAVEEFKAVGGAGVVMDVQNGAVVALVSLPDFNPQQAGNPDDDNRRNQATLGVYELGSTFKLITAAQGLELGLSGMTNTFNTVEPIRIGRYTIRDYHPEKHRLTLPEIIMHSSNIGAAHVAALIGRDRQRAFLEQIGTFKPVPIELPETGWPIVPDNWGEVETMTIGFGHGIAAAPLQLVRSVASLCNGGWLVTPTLLPPPPSPPAMPRLISADTSTKLRAMMRLVVTAGTAKAANAPGYLVGGKTGTAEKIAGKRYRRDARLSSFIGVFPLSAPRYVVFAMLDEPKGTKKTHGFATGGWVAAPVVGRVIAAAGPLLGVTPLDSIQEAAADGKILQPLGAALINKLIKPQDKPDTHDATDEQNAAAVTEAE